MNTHTHTHTYTHTQFSNLDESKLRDTIKTFLMNRFILLFTALCCFMSCNSGTQRSVGKENATGVELLAIDLAQKNYPEKRICLQDIADITYIPLETSNEVLVDSYAFIQYVSDNYIVVANKNQGGVFIFTIDGKIQSGFNNKGNSGTEYLNIEQIVFDEENGEMFILDKTAVNIFVYSKTGQYKRVLKYPEDGMRLEAVYNFNDTLLLAYDNYFQQDGGGYNKTPYLLISKKDGSIVSNAKIFLEKRFSKYYYAGYGFSYANICKYGHDFIISDMSSDTIFQLSSGGDLIPLVYNTPSVHDFKPKTMIYAALKTDNYFFLSKTTIDESGIAEKINEGKFNFIESMDFVYDFNDCNIYNYSLYNADRPKDVYARIGLSGNDIPINTDVNMINASNLKRLLQKDELYGELKAVAQKVNEEDNPVVILIKYKSTDKDIELGN